MPRLSGPLRNHSDLKASSAAGCTASLSGTPQTSHEVRLARLLSAAAMVTLTAGPKRLGSQAPAVDTVQDADTIPENRTRAVAVVPHPDDLQYGAASATAPGEAPVTRAGRPLSRDHETPNAR